jgi:hypothetical protein
MCHQSEMKRYHLNFLRSYLREVCWLKHHCQQTSAWVCVHAHTHAQRVAYKSRIFCVSLLWSVSGARICFIKASPNRKQEWGLTPKVTSGETYQVTVEISIWTPSFHFWSHYVNICRELTRGGGEAVPGEPVLVESSSSDR